MATKTRPGRYDCYRNAGADEPVFTLRATDPLAPLMIRLWAFCRDGRGNSLAQRQKTITVKVLFAELAGTTTLTHQALCLIERLGYLIVGRS